MRSASDTSTHATPPDLADVLDGLRTDAAALRRRGHARDADQLDAVAAQVATAASDVLTWWTLDDAAVAAGWTLARMRKHARAFASTPHVRVDGRRVWVRSIIVPRAMPSSIARAAGARAA